MEVFLFLGLLVIIITVITNGTRTRDAISILTNEIVQLTTEKKVREKNNNRELLEKMDGVAMELEKLRLEIAELKRVGLSVQQPSDSNSASVLSVAPTNPPVTVPLPPISLSVAPIFNTPPELTEEVHPDSSTAVQNTVQPDETPGLSDKETVDGYWQEMEESVAIAAFAAEPAPESEPQPAPSSPQSYASYPEEDSWFTRWLQNNPDLEKFIGEQLINKIGIAILVLGIAFFVKYAIDKDWINEIGRVSIGIGCGALLIAIAHYLRNSFRSFSSVLAGGGIAVFYFTIALAFHQYHLLPQAAAFVSMVVITGFAVALSVLYNKLELAVIATIGGFVTPFLLSTGEGNYMVLFTYLIILNIGLLALAWYRRWPAVNILSLIFTFLIYGSWLSLSLSQGKAISYPAALGFAAAFYFIFLITNMLNQVRYQTGFRPFDFSIILAINGAFFAAGMAILHYWHHGLYHGAFSVAMGAINLGLAFYVHKRNSGEKNFLFLLIGLTLSFLTLAIPVQLHGHTITLFWSAEFVLLYWLSTYSGISLFRYASILVCGLSIISLLMDWGIASADPSAQLLVIYTNTRGLVTNLVSIAACSVYAFLLARNPASDYFYEVSSRSAAKFFVVAAGLLLFLTAIFGVNLLFKTSFSYAIPNVYHRLIVMVYAFGALAYVLRHKDTVSQWALLPGFFISSVYYLISSAYIVDMRDMALAPGSTMGHLAAHWIGSALWGGLCYFTIRGIRSAKDTFSSSLKQLSVVVSLVIAAFVSVELLHLYVVLGYDTSAGAIDRLTSQFGKAGLTVIWAIMSFILMAVGMKHRQRYLRITALVFFGVVLAKLFLLDISNISDGGKILAFILLGAILLVVSFMYQKLKKLLMDDEAA